MSTDTLYKLGENVVISRVGDLPEDLRKKLKLNEDEYIMTKKGSRVSSKILSFPVAKFFQSFRNYTTLVDAIEDTSKELNLDSEVFLEQVYPFIETLIKSEWLVDKKNLENEEKEENSILKKGDLIQEYEVQYPIQLLEDTELYFLTKEDGSEAALKVLTSKAPSSFKKSLKKEAYILRLLNKQGISEPKFIAEGKIEDAIFCLMSWITGSVSNNVADIIRTYASKERQLEIKKLLISIIEAYIKLHSVGIIHSDIHPRNIIITNDGKAHLLDFSFSYFPDAPEEFKTFSRNIILQYASPDFADAKLKNSKPPVPTLLSEQYSLGALFYFLVTGKNYFNFSFDEKEQLQQILDEKPLSFAENDFQAWPDMEKVLNKMLEKDEEKRFSSLDECLKALSAVRLYTPRTSRKTKAQEDNSITNILELRDIAKINDIHFPAPSASLWYGSAGVAYTLYKKSLITQEPEVLSAADAWIVKAANEAKTTNSALKSDKLKLDFSGKNSVSTCHSITGIHYVQALISNAYADIVTENEAVDAIISITKNANISNYDTTLGIGSVLLAFSSLIRIRPQDKELKNEGKRIAQAVFDILPQNDIKEKNQFVTTYGFSHGWCGILYTLLRWYRANNITPPEKIKDLIDQLIAVGVETRMGYSWPRLIVQRATEASDTDNASWCNGSAGYIWLLCEAERTYKTGTYLELADKVATHATYHPENINNICCGLLGRALALFELFQATKDTKYLDSADYIFKQIDVSSYNDHSFFEENSLYKSRLGYEYFKIVSADHNCSSLPGVNDILF